MQTEGKNGKKPKQQTNCKTETRHTKENSCIQTVVGFITWAVQGPRSIDTSFWVLCFEFFHLIFQILVSNVLIPAWANHLMLLQHPGN